MKKLIIIIPLIFLLFSCKEEVFEPEQPIFVLEQFTKVDSLCTATIKIKGLTDKFSIDGIIKADKINNFQINSPQSEGINFSIIEDKITIWGKYAKNITINISWICTQEHETYLSGWHLIYGMGAGCNVLIVNLETK